MQNADLFEKESRDLIEDLRTLPRNSAIRKVNELVKRMRLAKVHALIIGHLKSQMPSMWGFEKKQKELTDSIVEEFRKVQIQHNLPAGDFPNVERFKQKLIGGDIKMTDFPKLKEKYVEAVDKALNNDIPMLMEKLPGFKGSAQKSAAHNPFAETTKSEGWVLTPEEKSRFMSMFSQLRPARGKLTGQQVKDCFVQLGLDMETLRDIWNLSDIDKDGHLDGDEFCVAMHLVNIVKQNGGNKGCLPTTLPLSLIPPSKY